MIQKSLFHERMWKSCSSDVGVVRKTYGRDRHHVITKAISLHRRDIQTMFYDRIMYHTKIPSWTILGGVGWDLRYELDRSHQYNVSLRLIKETCSFHYFFCNVCRDDPELDGYSDWYHQMIGYTNVLERDHKKFVSIWKHVRISICKMTTDMKGRNPSTRRNVPE